MKTMMVLILIFVLAALARSSQATSPMPEEVKPGMAATVCTIHITCTKDRETGTYEELTSTFAFEVSEPKKGVLEWVTKYVNNKLNERNLSGFKVDCRFPK
ncbi:MAG TPA: hypothetical protein VFG09_14275 [Thermodesulfovibrionales bacterium]|nr:hypothetical protein [Thermodesulfovibrionales bacterium]